LMVSKEPQAPSEVPMCEAPILLSPLIHPSAWNRYSANFALLGFSAPLCQAALLEGACESATRLLKTASEMRLLRHRSASLWDLPSAIFLR
jgi:hypothetical protein